MKTLTPPKITLDRFPPEYHPGDEVEVRVALDNGQLETCRAVEIALLWYTAGKGEEDIAVQDFERHSLIAPDAATDYQLIGRLPEVPLSYDGVIVKVCWSARVRLIELSGKQSIFETPFRLGKIASPSAEPPSEKREQR